MSAIKAIREAQEYYETMKDLHELGMVSNEAVAKARRELHELRFAEQSARTYGGELQDWTPEAVTA